MKNILMPHSNEDDFEIGKQPPKGYLYNISLAKLEGYVLNPNHKKGGDKAYIIQGR